MEGHTGTATCAKSALNQVMLITAYVVYVFFTGVLYVHKYVCSLLVSSLQDGYTARSVASVSCLPTFVECCECPLGGCPSKERPVLAC